MKKPGHYFKFPDELLESPAFDALTMNEWRALRRILVEHQSKAGWVNDGLIVTYRDFLRARIHPKHITNSLLVLVNLGFVKRTRSMGGSRTGRTPDMWKTTFLPTTPHANDATHDYLEHKTLEEAERIAEQHRFHEKRKGRTPQKKGQARKLRVVSSPSIITTTGKTSVI